jgi:hypothetical protein
MPIDFDELKESIKVMSRQTQLFKVLKEGLSDRGYWRNKPRGNPKKGYEAMKEKNKTKPFTKANKPKEE